jgi:putative transposase
VTRYRFIAEYAHEHTIRLMCEVLGVSRSGYYAFRRRGPSRRDLANERLVDEIRAVHEGSHGIYGSPRIHRTLKNKGISCGRHRIARLMAQGRIVARSRRRYRTTTRPRPGASVAPDLVQRQFVAERPHQVWTSDITYLWTMEGWLYLAVVLDLFSRAVVGWATSVRIDAGLVCQAYGRAFGRHRPSGDLISHSDRGSQYTSKMYISLIAGQSVPVHVSHGLSCYDNAVSESFFHTLKTEWVPFQENLTRAETHANLFQYLEVFYNNQRLHSSIGYLTPVEKLQGIITKAA